MIALSEWYVRHVPDLRYSRAVGTLSASPFANFERTCVSAMICFIFRLSSGVTSRPVSSR